MFRNSENQNQIIYKLYLKIFKFNLKRSIFKKISDFFVLICFYNVT